MRDSSTKKIRLTAEDLPYQDEFPEKVFLLAALKDKLDNKLSQKEFMEILITWSYQYVYSTGGYLPGKVVMKPIALVEFEKLSFTQRKKLDETTQNKINKIRDKYYSQIDSVVLKNKRDALWLDKMIDYYLFKQDIVKADGLSKIRKLYNVV